MVGSNEKLLSNDHYQLIDYKIVNLLIALRTLFWKLQYTVGIINNSTYTRGKLQCSIKYTYSLQITWIIFIVLPPPPESSFQTLKIKYILILKYLFLLKYSCCTILYVCVQYIDSQFLRLQSIYSYHKILAVFPVLYDLSLQFIVFCFFFFPSLASLQHMEFLSQGEEQSHSCDLPIAVAMPDSTMLGQGLNLCSCTAEMLILLCHSRSSPCSLFYT